MSAETIDYADKVTGTTTPFTADNANEIKNTANNHASLIDTNVSAIASNVSAIELLRAQTGWAAYEDDQYDSGSPLALAATTTTVLPNNGAVSSVGQAPVTFYSGGEIVGYLDTSIHIVISFKIVPAPGMQWIDIWLDAGGSSTELYRQTLTLPKGNVEQDMLYTIPVASMGADWDANNAEVKVYGQSTADIYDIKFGFGMSHNVPPA